MARNRFAPIPRAALVLSAAALLTVPAALAAQNSPAGHWEGAIRLPNAELGVIVDLTQADDGSWSGEIDIPMQGAKDLRLTRITVKGPAAAFMIVGPPGDPTFRGTLSDDGATIAGDFSQGGQTFPFTLRRAPAAGPRAPAPSREDPLDGFDELVRSSMERWDVPGVAIAIVRNDSVVLSKGYGLRDLEGDLPVTPRTLFAIGSATKAFTAMLLGMLMEDGKLDWSQPVRTYLPDFQLRDDFASARITPLDLVIHNSGLPRHDLVWYGSETPRDSLVHRVRYLDPNADFRERFQYQNLMYATAGHLAGRIAGTTWEALVRERIFRPLGARESNFSVDDLRAATDHATGYRKKEDTSQRPATADGGTKKPIAQRVERIPYRKIDNVGPAGSINSNVTEMIEWVRLHLNGGEAGGRPVVSATTLETLHTPRMVIEGGILSALFRQPEMPYLLYAPGWFVQPYRGHPMVHHGGNIDGFSALVSFLPQDGVGLVILTNLNGTPLPTVLALHAYDRLLGLDEIDWNDRYGRIIARIEESAQQGEKREAIDRKKGTRASHPLEEYAGTYAHPAYGELHIERRRNELHATFHGMEMPLEHWHYDVFRAQGEPADGTKLGFLTNLRGDIDRVSVPLEASVEPVVFEKRPPAPMYDPAFLRSFVGEYELMGRTVTVALRGPALTVTVPGQPTYELAPYRGTEFEIRRLQGYAVRFVLEGGRVREAVFIQPNGVFVATRK